MNSVALTLWRSAKPVGYWTVQSARFDYVASIGLPFDALTLAQGQASHLPVRHSPATFRAASHLNQISGSGFEDIGIRITAFFSARDAGVTVRTSQRICKAARVLLNTGVHFYCKRFYQPASPD